MTNNAGVPKCTLILTVSPTLLKIIQYFMAKQTPKTFFASIRLNKIQKFTQS